MHKEELLSTVVTGSNMALLLCVTCSQLPLGEKSRPKQAKRSQNEVTKQMSTNPRVSCQLGCGSFFHGGVASRTSPHPQGLPPCSAHAHWVSFQSLTGFPSCFVNDFSILLNG